jgi:hypothetical protein
VTHVFLRILPSGGAIVTEIFMFVIWQRVRSVLDINSVSSVHVSQTFVAAVNIYPFTLGRRVEKRAGAHAKCQLLPT